MGAGDSHGPASVGISMRHGHEASRGCAPPLAWLAKRVLSSDLGRRRLVLIPGWLRAAVAAEPGAHLLAHLLTSGGGRRTRAGVHRGPGDCGGPGGALNWLHRPSSTAPQPLAVPALGTHSQREEDAWAQCGTAAGGRPCWLLARAALNKSPGFRPPELQADRSYFLSNLCVPQGLILEAELTSFLGLRLWG